MGKVLLGELSYTGTGLILKDVTYLSTLPHKLGISRFSDHFTTSQSYFKNKPILTLFGPSPDFYFIAEIKKKSRRFLSFVSSRVYSFQGEGRPHFRLDSRISGQFR